MPRQDRVIIYISGTHFESSRKMEKIRGNLREKLQNGIIVSWEMSQSDSYFSFKPVGELQFPLDPNFIHEYNTFINEDGEEYQNVLFSIAVRSFGIHEKKSDRNPDRKAVIDSIRQSILNDWRWEVHQDLEMAAERAQISLPNM